MDHDTARIFIKTSKQRFHRKEPLDYYVQACLKRARISYTRHVLAILAILQNGVLRDVG